MALNLRRLIVLLVFFATYQEAVLGMPNLQSIGYFSNVPAVNYNDPATIDVVLEENHKLKEELKWLNDVITNNISYLANQIASVRTKHSEDIASVRSELAEGINFAGPGALGTASAASVASYVNNRNPLSTTSPPKTIEELIATIKPINVQNIDKSISENCWANKFRSWLAGEDINLLKFRLKIEAFERNERKISTNTKESQKAISDRIMLYKNIVMSHFDEYSDAKFGLSNSKDFNYFNKWARGPKNAISVEDVKILMKAKTDSDVLGLETSYKKFLAQTTSSKLKSCLSSIPK